MEAIKSTSEGICDIFIAVEEVTVSYIVYPVLVQSTATLTQVFLVQVHTSVSQEKKWGYIRSFKTHTHKKKNYQDC